MRVTKVTCDACGKDLTTRSNIEDYRLVLQSESKSGHGSGFYTCMAKYPPVDRAYHFCGLKCLDQWRDHERCVSDYIDGKWTEWKRENLEKELPSGARQYKPVPDEIREAWRIDAQSMASKTYPLMTDGQT